MKCPVCGTEYSNSKKCIQCEFDELDKTFINKDEYEYWLNNIVYAYKTQHLNRLFSPMNFSVENYELKKETSTEELDLPLRSYYQFKHHNINKISDILSYYIKKDGALCNGRTLEKARMEMSFKDVLFSLGILYRGDE